MMAVFVDIDQSSEDLGLTSQVGLLRQASLAKGRYFIAVVVSVELPNGFGNCYGAISNDLARRGWSIPALPLSAILRVGDCPADIVRGDEDFRIEGR
jgi:hypothetical protein